MNALWSIRVLTALLICAGMLVVSGPLVSGGEWQVSSKVTSTGKWEPRLVRDERQEPQPVETQNITFLEPLFLKPVTTDLPDASDRQANESPFPPSTETALPDTAPDVHDDPKDSTSAPAPAPAPPPTERDSAIVLEGPDDPWRPKLPFEQSSTSWTLRGSKTNGLGIFSLESGGNRAVQFQHQDDTRFEGHFQTSIHWLSGPGRTDMPPRLFDFFYNVHLIQPLGPSLAVDANFDLGLYTDFEDSVRDGWRFPGRAVLYSEHDENTQFVVGMEYLDTDIVQLLPAGGVILTPDDHTRLELYFPKPSARFLIDDAQEEQRWLYLSGEYQTRAWAVERTAGNADVASLNEYKVSLGVETLAKVEGTNSTFSEISWLFNRELHYRSGVGSYEPDDTLMFRFGSRF